MCGGDVNGRFRALDQETGEVCGGGGVSDEARRFVRSPLFRCSSRFNDPHFQSSINGLKRLLESVHSGGVVNIEDTVNLWHVPTKPPPKFSLGDSLLSHRVIQLNLWHGQCWNTDHFLSLRGLWQPLPVFHVCIDHGQKGV